MEVLDEDGETLTRAQQPIAGFVEPAHAGPGYGLTALTLVERSTLESAATQVLVARVRLSGRSLDGVDVEGAPWDFPVEVCDGCVGCEEPDSCDDDLRVVCRVGQEVPSDCRCTGSSMCGTSVKAGCF